MSYGEASSFFTLDCTKLTKEEYSALLAELDSNNEWHSLFDPIERAGEIDLWLRDYEITSDLDERLERFYSRVTKAFNVAVNGYIIEDVEGSRYRGEFDKDGKLWFVDYDWLNLLNNEQTRELKMLVLRWRKNKSQSSGSNQTLLDFLRSVCGTDEASDIKSKLSEINNVTGELND